MTTTTTSGCGDTADTGLPAVRKVTSLCAWSLPLTTAQRLQRTLDYIQDPHTYLKQTLGEEDYNARKHLFQIAPSYDKDIYGSRGHKIHFEQNIAKTFSKGHGIFFVTGIQAQAIALLLHCKKRKSMQVAWHASTHLEDAERCAYSELYGLQRTLIGKPETMPTVEKLVQLTESPSKPAAILLEIPSRVLGCRAYTYDELVKISTACKQHNIALHLDGARLWKLSSWYEQTAGKTLADIAGLFDTVYLSFYKDLAGITGAMLLSDDAELITEAKIWQRRAGGNPYTLMYETIDCERGYNENIGTFNARWQKMRDIAHKVQSATSTYDILEFSPREPICSHVRVKFHGYTAKQLLAARDKVQEDTGIRVFEMVCSKYSLDEKMNADDKGTSLEDLYGDREDKRHEIEWPLSDVTEAIPTETCVEGFVALCKALSSSS